MQGESGEEFGYGFAEAIAGDVEGTLLYFVSVLWRNAQSGEDGRVEVFDNNTLFDGLARAFIRRAAMEIDNQCIALFRCAGRFYSFRTALIFS